MPDKLLIFRLISNIETYLKELKSVEKISFEEYQSDIIKQRFIERTIHLIIESVLDIAHHIVSDEKYREPNSYSDSFNVLFENKIIKSDTKTSCVLMAQFRNRLVHYYEKNDPEIVYGIFKKHIYELESFLDDVRSYLVL